MVPDELKCCDGYPVLGYYGAIAEWLDCDLSERLARQMRDVKIVLIGPVCDSVSRRFLSITTRYSNLLLIPQRKQLELVPFLKHFDVCMIPFVKNDVTDAV